MSTDVQRERERISERISILRNLVILLSFCSLASLLVIAIVPELVQPEIRYWLIGGGSFVFVFTVSVSIIARKDATITLFFTIFGAFLAGVILGVTLASLKKLVQ